jgi:hypothetical protein
MERPALRTPPAARSPDHSPPLMAVPFGTSKLAKRSRPPTPVADVDHYRKSDHVGRIWTMCRSFAMPNAGVAVMWEPATREAFVSASFGLSPTPHLACRGPPGSAGWNGSRTESRAWGPNPVLARRSTPPVRAVCEPGTSPPVGGPSFARLHPPTGGTTGTSPVWARIAGPVGAGARVRTRH